MTLSTSPVTYTVQTYSETIATGNVTNTTLAKLTIPSNLVVLDSSYQHRYKGIHVSASCNEVSVLLINYRLGSVGDYLAYPVQNLNHSLYQYYAVSTGTSVFSINPQSEVLLVGTEDDTTVTVVPTQNVIVPRNIQLFNSMEMTVAAGTPFSFTLHELQTFLLGAPRNDLTGTIVLYQINHSLLSVDMNVVMYVF